MQAASRDLQSTMGFIEGDNEEMRCAGRDEIEVIAATQRDLVTIRRSR